MSTITKRYKSNNGKRVFLCVSSQDTGFQFLMNFETVGADLKSIFVLNFQLAYFTRNELFRLVRNKPYEEVLFHLGLKIAKEKIDNDDLQDETIGEEKLVEMVNKFLQNDSSEDIFSSKLKIQNDILRCVYEKQEESVTFNELVNYVWCDSKLLISELVYLIGKGAITGPGNLLEDELDAGSYSNKRIYLTPAGKTEYQSIRLNPILKNVAYFDIMKDCVPFASNKTVFLAHSFGEESLIGEIKEKLTEVQFSFKEGKVKDLSSITEDILNKIRESGFFLALLTPKKEFAEGGFSTGPLILMEIGAALAYGRTILILAEDKVDKDQYEAKLQGNHEYLNFDKDNFSRKVKEAVDKIVSEWKKRKEDGRADIA